MSQAAPLSEQLMMEEALLELGEADDDDTHSQNKLVKYNVPLLYGLGHRCNYHEPSS
jgi:hypothetical protein